MAKFSNVPAAVQAPVRSKTRVPDSATYEGGAGFSRDAKSELFMLAISNMVEGTFYESARSRDGRFVGLVHQVTQQDPEWVARFVPYLRGTMNMRSVAVVMACEYVKAGGPNGRTVINSACVRADEPGEILGYWMSTHGRAIPKPVKRGVADAAIRLYNERNAFRYDGQSRGIRMADVINLTHPKPKAAWQDMLFKYLLDKRYKGGAAEVPSELLALKQVEFLQGIPEDQRRSYIAENGVGEAPVSWEWLSGWIPGGMDAQAWESVIPNMGYMALLRNLRNFDQAGISREMVDQVKSRLSDPDEVARSRQFPLRFLSAWKEVQTLHWGESLEDAIQLSVANVPSLPGKTLVLWDCSYSMVDPLSARSKAMRWEAAGIFAVAVAQRSESADLYAYSNDQVKLDYRGSILRTILEIGGRQPTNPWSSRDSVLWGGTDTFGSLSKTFKGHDRVIIVTDEQAHPGYDSEFLSRVPKIYTFNLAGYRTGHAPVGRDGRYAFGGLSDAGFKAIELLESGKDDDWPF